MMDLHTKDDKEMIVKSTLQSPAVLDHDQILDIQGPKIPSWGKRPICAALPIWLEVRVDGSVVGRMAAFC